MSKTLSGGVCRFPERSAAVAWLMSMLRFLRLRRGDREIAGHAGAAAFWRIDFQAAAHQLRPVLHDMKTETLLWREVLGKPDAVINDTQNHLLPDSLESDHDLPGVGVLVGIDDRLTRHSIEVCGDLIIVDVK